MTVSPEDEILDSSAGTGLLAESLLKKHECFERLVLNDPSSKMLARARYRLRYHENVEFCNLYSENLPFDDRSFTQIICLNSFHYYTHQTDVLKHFYRVMKPGGNLWILDWNRTGTFKITSKLIDWLSPENINARTLEEMELLLEDAGFNMREKESWGYRWWNFLFVRCERTPR